MSKEELQKKNHYKYVKHMHTSVNLGISLLCTYGHGVFFPIAHILAFSLWGGKTAV